MLGQHSVTLGSLAALQPGSLLILSLSYCAVFHVTMCFLWVVRFPPTPQTHKRGLAVLNCP